MRKWLVSFAAFALGLVAGSPAFHVMAGRPEAGYVPIVSVRMDRPWPAEWDSAPGYHFFRDGAGRPWAVVHGCEGCNKVVVDGRAVGPEYLVQTLVDDGDVAEGERLTIVCCHPGDKVAGRWAGVSYDFVGSHKGVSYISREGDVFVVSRDR